MLWFSSFGKIDAIFLTGTIKSFPQVSMLWFSSFGKIWLSSVYIAWGNIVSMLWFSSFGKILEKQWLIVRNILQFRCSDFRALEKFVEEYHLVYIISSFDALIFELWKNILFMLIDQIKYLLSFDALIFELWKNSNTSNIRFGLPIPYSNRSVNHLVPYMIKYI